MIVLDFETQSTAELPDVGSWNYSRDPMTRVVCLAWWDPVREGVELWYPRDRYPDVTCPWSPLDDLYRLIREGHGLHAWNASFERDIWENIMVPRHGAPEVPAGEWYCTMAQAAAAGYPLGLAAAAKALGLREQKDQDGHRTMLQVARPRRLKSKPGIHWHDDQERIEKVLRYCLQDVRTELEAAEALPPLTDFERRVWLVDQEINRRGVGIDRALCDNAVAVYAQLEDELTAELARHTNDEITSAGQVARIRAYCEARGVEIGSLRQEVVDRALAHPRLPDDVRRVLEIRRTLSKSSVKKYAAAAQAADPDDDRLRGSMQYHGATVTGRWAGRKLQPQNLPADRHGWSRGMDYDTMVAAARGCDLATLRLLYDSPERLLALATRGMIVPAPGHDFVAIDYASIEARVLLWLAGDAGLEVYREGGNLYKVMAARRYGCRPEDIEKPSPEYNLGKAAVLGLGYFMGAKAFVRHALAYGVELTEADAQESVDTYRATFPKVPELWAALEDGARQAINAPPGRDVPVGCMAWFRDEYGVGLRLPSGRALRYPGLELAPSEKPWGLVDALRYRGTYGPTETYSGKLAENATQAVARDLLAAALVRLADAGHRVAFHVHDEAVLEIPKGEPHDEAVALFLEPPAWAAGLPIDGEAWRGPTFRK